MTQPRRDGETISTAAGMINRLDFKGRVAVITGGAVSIGYAIAQRLAASDQPVYTGAGWLK
jgi:3-oxoacyl-ACP reductase-like protein